MSEAALEYPGIAAAVDRRGERRAIAGLLLLCVLWLLAVGCPFTQLDDPTYITLNPIVQQGFSLHSIGWSFTYTKGEIWFPLTWISLALDSTIFGMGPAGFHFTNVVLHVGSVVLLFLFLHRTTGALGRSFAATALWAIHPLRVESVAWAAERKDVLSVFLGLLALLAYVRYTRTKRLGPYLGSVGLLCLSLLAKPTLVTFPCLLLVVDYWPLSRWKRGRVGALLVEKAGFFVPALIVSWITYAVQSPHVVSGARNPLPLRLENAALSYALYLRDLFYWGGLSVWYPRPSAIPAWEVGLSAGVLAAVTAAALWMARRPANRPVLAGWLWFLGTLVPMIQLVQSGEQGRASRFTYFPMIGAVVMVVWGIPARWLARPGGRRLAIGVTAAALIACAADTVREVLVWHDPIALYKEGIARTSTNWWLWMAMGAEEDQRGNREAAIAIYEHTVEMEPRLHEIQNNLGSMLAASGRLDLAVEHFRKAHETIPGNAVYAANYARAQAMLATQRAAPASETSSHSLQEQP